MMKLFRCPNFAFFVLLFLQSVFTSFAKGEPESLIKFESERPPSLRFTSAIRCIFEDSKDRIWIGSHSEGVACFDGTEIRYFTVENGLNHAQVRTISEATDGTIWFECAVGLSYFSNNVMQPVAHMEYGNVAAWFWEPGDLWFKGEGAIQTNDLDFGPGVYHVSKGQLYFHRFPEEWIAAQGSNFKISTPCVYGKEQLYFGAYGAVISYDRTQLSLINDSLLGFEDSDSGQLHIRSLFEDSKGQLWIGNNGLGVLRYANGSLEEFSLTHGLVAENSLRNGSKSPAGTLEHVFAIAEDARGNIWFGDRDTGFWRYDGEQCVNFTEKDGLSHHHGWTIVQLRSGELLFGLEDGGIYRYNGTRFERMFSE